MEVKEAIRRIKDHFRIHNDGRPTPFLDEAVSMAIQSLEKQIPKTVIRYGDDESDHVFCPSCNECIGSNEIIYDDFYLRGWSTMYCQECGQAMIWK